MGPPPISKDQVPAGDRPDLSLRFLAFVFFGFFVACVLSLAWMWTHEPTVGPSNRSQMRLELFKAFLQMGVVALAGTALSLLIWVFQRGLQLRDKERDIHRANLRYREDLLMETLGRATVAYNQSKRAKRKLRALGKATVGSQTCIVVSAYDELMDSLNESQLALEVLKRDVETSEAAFPASAAIVANLELMEKYLASILKEYERKRPALVVEGNRTAVAELPKLDDFLRTRNSKEEKRPIDSNFYEPFDLIQGKIREALVHAELRSVA